MSGSSPAGDEPPTDLATVTRDDLLLDALAGGAEPPAGDGLAGMLAAWRAEIGTAAQADADPATDPNADVGVDVGVGVEPGPVPGRTETTRVPATVVAPARFWTGDRLLRSAAALLAVVGLSAGLVIGSGHAGPTSPLWSLTKVIHPQQAEVRSAEHAIDRARTAIAAGRPDEARQLIDRALGHLANVTDPGTAARLRAELDALLRDLAATTPPTSPTPGAPTGPPAPVGTGGPGPGGPAPAPGTSPQAPPGTPPGESPAPGPSTGPVLPLPTLLPVPIPSVLDPLLPDPLLPTELPLG